MSDDQKRLADALQEPRDHNFMKIHESRIKFIYSNSWQLCPSSY